MSAGVSPFWYVAVASGTAEPTFVVTIRAWHCPWFAVVSGHASMTPRVGLTLASCAAPEGEQRGADQQGGGRGEEQGWVSSHGEPPVGTWRGPLQGRPRHARPAHAGRVNG